MKPKLVLVFCFLAAFLLSSQGSPDVDEETGNGNDVGIDDDDDDDLKEIKRSIDSLSQDVHLLTNRLSTLSGRMSNQTGRVGNVIEEIHKIKAYQNIKLANIITAQDDQNREAERINTEQKSELARVRAGQREQEIRFDTLRSAVNKVLDEIKSRASCPAPGSVTNGKLDGSSTIQYLTCNQGYVAAGASVSTCQQGTWVPPLPALTCSEGQLLVTGGPQGSNTTRVYLMGEGRQGKRMLSEIPEKRRYHSLSFVDGALYLCGGEGANSCLRGTRTEVNGVADLIWSQHSSLPTPRSGSSSVTYRGDLYLLGGSGALSATTTLHMNPAYQDSWSGGFSLGGRLEGGCAVRAGGNKMVTVSGLAGSGAKVIMYDLLTRSTVKPLPDPPSQWSAARGFSCGYYKQDTKEGLIVVGGQDGSGTGLKSTYFLDLKTETWSKMSDFPYAVYGAGDLSIKEGTVLLFGGAAGGAPLSHRRIKWRLHVETGVWAVGAGVQMPPEVEIVGPGAAAALIPARWFK